MLARINRITKKEDFEKVKSEGKTIPSESFTFSYYSRDDDKPPKFGFIVTKKISTNAAARNKATRSMREGVRQTISYVKAGYNCVLVAKPIIVRKYTTDVMREVDIVLQKAGLMQSR